MTNLVALPEGTVLVGDYRIERVLGAGGFGITYLATEIALDRAVTIKEYFPSDFAARVQDQGAGARSQGCAEDYRWGLDRFIEEAQTLAKFDHPHIVRVYRYFRANNTAYMVLHFEEGQSLKGWLKGLGRAPRQKELDAILAPLLDALEIIHKADFLHRDIAPDNIMIRKGGAPVLIDFGSARGEIAAHSKTVSALVKPGYSPYEQYAETSRQQGPWTDIYALGATLYHAVTGKRPPDAPSRMVKDEMVSSRDAALSSYRASFLKAIDRSLALNVDSRPQSIAAWRGDLLAPEPAKPGWLSRSKDKKQSPAEPAPGPRLGSSHPLPDVPGPQGGMLDLVDGLRRATAPASPSPSREAPREAARDPAPARQSADAEPGAAHTARIDDAPPPPPFFLRRMSPKPPAEPARQAEAAPAAARPAESRAVVVVPTPERRAPRPRPVKSFERRSLRPLLFKLLIGAGVASAAVAVQDRLPHFESRGASVPTSQTAPPPSQPHVAIAVPLQTIKAHKGAATAVDYTTDGSWIVTAGGDASLKVWNTATGSLVRTIELDDGPATSVALSAHRALTSHGNGRIVLWDLDRAEKLSSFRANEASVWSVTFAGSPERFAAAGHDWKLSLWDTRNPTAPAHVFDGHESAVQAVAFTPRGPYLASGGADRTVRLWNIDTLDQSRTYKGHKDFVTSLAFSDDGKLLASAGLDGSIRLWSTTSRRLQRVLSGHKGRVASLAFAPSGDLLASASEDGTLRLWNFKRGRTARALLGHAGPVRAVAFSPDGTRLASSGDDGTIKIWGMDTVRQARADRDD